MQLEKHSNTSSDVLPLLAALSYSITLDKVEEKADAYEYDPTMQRTVYAMGSKRESRCRVDDSVGGIFNVGSTKSDTKKDD